MLFIHSFTILSFLCSISDRKYKSEVYILLCRSYILMDCSDFIVAQPITHLLLRCCDRAKFWTSCCCTVQILRMRIYTCEVCILRCRSYILMDWSDIILAQPITHSLLRCCDRAKYWTSCTVQILRMRIYTCEVCILLCRSYILMDCSDFILAQPITHSLLRCCDRANFVRAAAYATNYARARKVCILLCRSYILMDCSDFIVAQLITH